MLLVSVWRASIMSYLLPARYFHPRRSSGLTLLDFESLCFTVGNKNADSCLLWCSLHSVMRSPVLWVACKMTAVFNFNIKVCARSPQIFSDSCVCSRIMWHCAMERALQGGNSWNNTFRNAQMFWKRGNLDEQTHQTRFHEHGQMSKQTQHTTEWGFILPNARRHTSHWLYPFVCCCNVRK